MSRLMKVLCAAIVMSATAFLCGWVVVQSWAQDAGPGGNPFGPKDNPKSTTVPKPEDPAKGPLVAYTLRHADPKKVSTLLAQLFPNRAEIVRIELGTKSVLFVSASADTHTNIQGVIAFLDAAPPTPVGPSSADRGMAVPRVVDSDADQGGFWGAIAIPYHSNRQRIEAAAKNLRDAKTDADKQAARSALRKTLASIFAEDMQAREKHAKEIETRLAKLRQQYRAREQVKDEIIELQLKVLEKEAAGLGFPQVGPTSKLPMNDGFRDTPLSKMVYVETKAMLQGTWQCVGVSADGKKENVKDAAPWDLQFKIAGDKVTVSYLGDNLKRYSTAGQLTIDASKSPPQFFIDINVAGWQEGARLTGRAVIDRGILRMSRLGGAFLIVGRKLDVDPAVFEFKRPSHLPGGGNETEDSPMAALGMSGQVTVDQMLAFKPAKPGVEFDVPTAEEAKSCRVALEKGAAWILLSREGTVLRRFEDTNRDNKVDIWRFYKAGREAYRDIDSDHDGRIDQHVHAK